MDTMVIIFFAIIAGALLVMVAYLAFQEGRLKGAKDERAWRGTPVEAQIAKGKDGKYGASIGEQRPTKFNADWITTGGDRHVTRDDVVALVRKYWPEAYIYEPETGASIRPPVTRAELDRNRSSRDAADMAVTVATM